MEEFPERRRERQLAFPQAPSSSSSSEAAVEKEHMFDKVVTPSDVGKLNRLVIPKQHAEKHFPLDPACGDKGLSLCFEDRAGKQWRFRYSYWTSSQSYVMTKGWSRFVKEKRLDAGDTVSFQRGLGELARHRLFIDWRRRPEPPIPHAPAIMSFAPWAGFVDADPRRQHLGFPPEALWYLRSTAAPAQIPVQLGGPLVLSSVPVIPSAAAAKRVRLFGVNLADSAASAGDPAERLRLSLGLSPAADSPPADHPAMSLELKM